MGGELPAQGRGYMAHQRDENNTHLNVSLLKIFCVRDCVAARLICCDISLLKLVPANVVVSALLHRRFSSARPAMAPHSCFPSRRVFFRLFFRGAGEHPIRD